MSSSRFISETELDASRPTKGGVDQEYDPRSLFERLQSNKEEKDAKYDEMYKLSNQFRGIDEGESEFLAQVDKQRRKEEEEKRRKEREELERFRAAKAGAGGAGKKEEQKQDPMVKAAEGKVDGDKKAEAKADPAGKKKRKATSSLLGVVKKKPTLSTTATTKDNGKKEQADKSKSSTTSKLDTPQVESKTT